MKVRFVEVMSDGNIPTLEKLVRSKDLYGKLGPHLSA